METQALTAILITEKKTAHKHNVRVVEIRLGPRKITPNTRSPLLPGGGNTMPHNNSEMPMRTLGRTGVQVSLIGLGGWHIGFNYIDEQLSVRIVRTAIDNGVNFMDNCWDYNDGASEIRMGKALRDGYRDRAFLITKIDGRTKKDAAKQLDGSLRRMQTDCIELVKQNIGVLAMKTLANGMILGSKTASATECLQYAMNLPVSVVITGCESIEDLDQALAAARTFKPMSEEQVSSLLAKTAQAASRGEYELFKTTSVYDGTAAHPEWLGEEPPEVLRVLQV